jgi:hypothetical protein
MSYVTALRPASGVRAVYPRSVDCQDCGPRSEPGSADDGDWEAAHGGGWLCLDCVVERIKASDL